jgi:hypothetical protein
VSYSRLDGHLAEAARKRIVPVLLCGTELRKPLAKYQWIDGRRGFNHVCGYAVDRPRDAELPTKLAHLIGVGEQASIHEVRIDRQLTSQLAGPVATLSGVLRAFGVLLLALFVVRPFPSNLSSSWTAYLNALVGGLGLVLLALSWRGHRARRRLNAISSESQLLALTLLALIRLRQAR